MRKKGIPLTANNQHHWNILGACGINKGKIQVIESPSCSAKECGQMRNP